MGFALQVKSPLHVLPTSTITTTTATPTYLSTNITTTRTNDITQFTLLAHA